MRQHARVEVDEEADLDLRESQVGQELRLMNRQKSSDRFQLEHDAVIDDDIEGVGAVETNRLVDDRERTLPFERQTQSMQLEAEAFFVGRLEKSWTECSVNLDSCPDDCFGELPNSL